MQALVFERSIPRYLWTRLLSSRSPRLATAPGTCLHLQEVPEPAMPGPSWVRVRTLLSGICGSDLSVIKCHGSLYLSAFTSFPFTPGHEVYGEVMEVGSDVASFSAGDRIAVEPALGCEVRGFSDPCPACREGRYANCVRVTQGDIAEGLQTGFCRSVSGGWSAQLVAHESQLHRVPDGLSPEAAVLAEPLSCAVHGVLKAGVGQGDRVLVVGCGSIGLLTVAALRALAPDCQIVAMAKYRHQRALAQELGANHVVGARANAYGELAEIIGADLRSLDMGKPAVVGGFPFVFECVGSVSALDDALRWARENSTVVMQGMPSDAGADLVPLWYKQLRLVGAYAYGVEEFEGKRVKTFQLAFDLLQRKGPGQSVAGLVSHRFPLKRYRGAITTAMRAGQVGAVKTVFDLINGAA
ncbi:MAG: zinc-binding dehydrogenase [Dehalococcoidia bacterium]